MYKVFVSHASADQKLVNEFVDIVLKLGCELRKEEIFYTSAIDTGVPSGHDLMHYIRERVGEASLVIAVITPMYQTRPVCIAELGAAWSRSGNLFPLLAPHFSRRDLQGILPGLLTRHIDQAEALDELKDRVGTLTGHDSGAKTWGKYRAQWLARVKTLSKTLAAVPKSADLARAEETLEETQAALGEALERIDELESAIEKLQLLKDSTESAQVLLPKDEKRRFSAYVDKAKEGLQELPDVVSDAVWHGLSDAPMGWPDPFDNWRSKEAEDAVNGGLLNDVDGRLYINTEFGTVERALTAVNTLQWFLTENASGKFRKWFRTEYDMPPDLSRKAVWDALLG